MENRFNQLENSLANEFLQHVAEESRERLKWAAKEASAIAWAFPYPLLLLPVLMEEKVQTAKAQARRQEEIRSRSRDELALAV